MESLTRGKKKSNATAGAPFRPATEHSDGPDERPRREVPTSDTTGDEPGDQPITPQTTSEKEKRR